MRVYNLLEAQRRLRERLRAEWQQPSPLPQPLEGDDPLLIQLYSILDTHLDNSAFGVEALCTAVGMSRMSLHRKLKGLIDLSAGEFVRNYRLKRAIELLEAGKRANETAYAVGFESPSHFAQLFREQYGLTPSQWQSNRQV